MKAAIPDYMKFGAVREMHQPKAAGTALRIEVDETTKATNFEALVVDPVAVKKVQTGVYKGFSIGGKVTKRKQNDHTVIEQVQLTEISLVDRPANPEATIAMWKADQPEDGDPSSSMEATVPDEPKTGEGTAPAPDTPPQPAAPEDGVEKKGSKYNKMTKAAIRGIRKAMREGNDCLKAFEDLPDEDDPNEGDHPEPDGDEGTATSEGKGQNQPAANGDGKKPNPFGAKADQPDGLAKLQSDFAELLAKYEALEKKLNEPAPPKGALMLPPGVQLAKKDAEDPTHTSTTVEDDSALGAMKKAQASPRRMF
jgi:hypothetical protein